VAAASAHGVTRRFGTALGTVVAIDAVDMTVLPQQLTVIAGPSGSGKSTLLGLFACVDRPDSGAVHIGALNVTGLGRRRRRRLRRAQIGIVLPQPSDNLLDALDAMGNLVWSARQRVRATGRPGPDATQQLDSVGLAGAEHKQIRELSGGEQQRLAIACALAGDPTIVVADEPTASLDRANAAGVVEVLRAAADRGVTLIVAGHDRQLIDAADTVVELDHGRRVA
jgi:ABC-type lipoprotein export system ATPase subunit